MDRFLVATKEGKENVAPSPIKKKVPKKKKGKKTVEQTYQKKTQREHILLRPDTYIGSIQKDTRKMWLFDDVTKKMVLRDNITFVPGLYKIFDEILVNAADNKQRAQDMSLINITINKEKGKISVWNNGAGIPIQIHKEHKVYVPELIFGHLLTSSNYDDDQKKVTGGRNGFGAKLVNIYSKEFIVETASSETGKIFYQKHTDNMTKRTPPKIKDNRRNEDWTKITFKPDFKRFKMDGLDDHTYELLKKRVVDLAGVTDKSVKVKLNGEAIPIKNFKDYLSLYISEQFPIIYEKVSDRWEIGMSVTDGHFSQVSFVNSICTVSGGTHVNYVADALAKKVLEAIRKARGTKATAKNIKPRQIKDFMFLFVNCLIENPSFESQTKETVVTKTKDFGSKCELSEAFIKKVQKSALISEVMAMARHKESRQLKRSDGRKSIKITGIPKLDDANDAGTKHSKECTLILTEGDSAKALAMSGLSIVGRDRYGVFPLKGKLLNVRDASHKQILNNAEITAIKKIVGLKDKVDYGQDKNLATLRYGKVMIMADQDYDGSHIKGLVINLFHHYWPTLVKKRNFLNEFITPIVVAKRRNETETFYTVPEYEQWKESVDGQTGWKIKYYKGLGTSTAQEGKKYFAKLSRHKIDFMYSGIEDDINIDMAFAKKKADMRKTWMENSDPNTFLDQNVSTITYSEFINKELLLYSLSSVQRAIPSIMDGLKPGQRKILFSCFKKNLKKEIKVAQLAGYVSEKSAYHHGEISLTSTIVGMAQNFVGSNNINVLYPGGQFGTRHGGGKDSASARYIFTKLSPVTRSLFPEDDELVLNFLDDDGLPIEPEFYAPVIPMVLVNGAEGIGTGWSTKVPNYNPLDLIRNVKLLLEGQPQKPLEPWYSGWTGAIRKNRSDNNYLQVGRIKLHDSHNATITELPIKTWTENYKGFLEELILKQVLSEFRAHHTDTTVSFTVTTNPNHPFDGIDDNLIKQMKLGGSIATTNMVLFGPDGKLKQYSSAENILRDYYDTRLDLYKKRKQAMIDKLNEELLRLQNKVRFILHVVEGRLELRNQPKSKIVAYLRKKKFKAFPKKKIAVGVIGDEEEDEDSLDGEEKMDESQGDFDYLLNMSIMSLTLEKVKKLQKECKDKQTELDNLRGTSIKRMWLNDIDAFETGYAEHLAEQRKQAKKDAEMIKKSSRRRKETKFRKPTKPKKTADDVKVAKDGFFHPPKDKKSGKFAPVKRKLSTLHAGESWDGIDDTPVRKKRTKSVTKGAKGKGDDLSSVSSKSSSSSSTTSTTRQLKLELKLVKSENVKSENAKSENVKSEKRSVSPTSTISSISSISLKSEAVSVKSESSSLAPKPTKAPRKMRKLAPKPRQTYFGSSSEEESAYSSLDDDDSEYDDRSFNTKSQSSANTRRRNVSRAARKPAIVLPSGSEQSADDMSDVPVAVKEDPAEEYTVTSGGDSDAYMSNTESKPSSKPKPSTKPKPAPKKKSVTKPKPRSPESSVSSAKSRSSGSMGSMDSDFDDSDDGLTLMQKLALRNAGPSGAGKRKIAQILSSSEESEDSATDEEVSQKKQKTSPAPKAKAAPTKAAPKPKPKPIAPPKKVTKSKPKAAPKRVTKSKNVVKSKKLAAVNKRKKTGDDKTSSGGGNSGGSSKTSVRKPHRLAKRNKNEEETACKYCKKRIALTALIDHMADCDARPKPKPKPKPRKRRPVAVDVSSESESSDESDFNLLEEESESEADDDSDYSDE